MRPFIAVLIVAALAAADKAPAGRKASADKGSKGSKGVPAVPASAVAPLKSAQEIELDLVKKGPDGRPLLFPPNIEMCKNSKEILFKCS